MASAGFGAFWGVALLIWDVMTATATQWRGFYKGSMTEGTLYFEAFLGLAYSAICTVGLLLVCDACQCRDISHMGPRSEYHPDTVAASSIRPDGDLNQSVTWIEPNPNVKRTDRPTGTPPPVYRSKRQPKRKKAKNRRAPPPEETGHYNPAFTASRHQLPISQTNFGPPSQSEWI